MKASTVSVSACLPTTTLSVSVKQHYAVDVCSLPSGLPVMLSCSLAACRLIACAWAIASSTVASTSVGTCAAHPCFMLCSVLCCFTIYPACAAGTLTQNDMQVVRMWVGGADFNKLDSFKTPQPANVLPRITSCIDRIRLRQQPALAFAVMLPPFSYLSVCEAFSLWSGL